MLTLYAFSTENWSRPESEINVLMNLLKRFVRSERELLVDKEIRLNVIGQFDRLPPDVQAELGRVMEETAGNRRMVLNLALSYGARQEISDAAKMIGEDILKGKLRTENVTEAVFAGYLYTAGMPDPDILIRTSGEMRLSNFLLWQAAYTELFVSETLWPDFTQEEFLDIIARFQKRNRRFGNV